jgi:hypothetical protein
MGLLTTALYGKVVFTSQSGGKMATASEIFGETYEGLELHQHAIKDGTAYWVQWNDSNPRASYPRTELKAIFNDGEVVEVDIESEQELKLWTEHL